MEQNTLMYDLRTHAGLTKVEVARRAHITPATYAGYEAGKHNPPSTTLARIARIFGVSVKTLVDRDFELMYHAWCGISEEQRHIIARQAMGMFASRQKRLGAKRACDATQDIILCPRCDEPVNVSGTAPDEKIECPKCGQKIKVQP